MCPCDTGKGQVTNLKGSSKLLQQAMASEITNTEVIKQKTFHSATDFNEL